MITNLPYNEKVSFFFGDQPHQHETDQGQDHSTLSLIFHDIKLCGDPGSNKLAFPRAILLMVAVDLMAKLFCGSDKDGESGTRFRAFVDSMPDQNVCGSDFGDKLWAFRNALHHSYRLPAKWGRPKQTPINTRFMLRDEPNGQNLIWEKNNSSETHINLCRLQQVIEAGRQRFHQSAAACTDVAKQNDFTSMFNLYGWLTVSQRGP